MVPVEVTMRNPAKMGKCSKWTGPVLKASRKKRPAISAGRKHVKTEGVNHCQSLLDPRGRRGMVPKAEKEKTRRMANY